jgi:hypothetical protein
VGEVLGVKGSMGAVLIVVGMLLIELDIPKLLYKKTHP